MGGVRAAALARGLAGGAGRQQNKYRAKFYKSRDIIYFHYTINKYRST
jgi:hypothetical protein